MAGPYSLPPARPGRDPADLVRWRPTTVLLAALPLVSLGLLAVVSCAWLAIRRRTRRTRAAAVLVAAASGTEYVLISVYPSQPGPPTWALSPLILLTWLGATAQFLIELTLWRRDVLPSPDRPVPYPAEPAGPAWQPYPPGPRRPGWTGPFAQPGYAAPPVPPGASMPASPASAVPAPPVPSRPASRPVPPASAAPTPAVPPRGPLDDDTISADLGAELRLLGAEFGRDAGAAADAGPDAEGRRRPGPGGAR